MTKLTKEQVKFFIETMTDDMHNTTQHKIAETLLSKFGECESLQAKLLAYEQAAKNPIGSFHISGGQVEATTDYCRDGEWPVQDGEVLVYAAPVLPKQPELVDLSQQVEILNRILNWILKELPVPTQKASTMAIRLSSVIDIISDLEVSAPAQPVIPEQAKPVAYTDNRNLKSLQKKGCATALLWLERNSEVGDIPLYTEVPAQPVSEPYKLPEGWVMVPQQIFLDASDIESICSQCGDGHKSGYGDFTDGLLWIGDIQCDNGTIMHGLHISSSDYQEEGGLTLAEFKAPAQESE